MSRSKTGEGNASSNLVCRSGCDLGVDSTSKSVDVYPDPAAAGFRTGAPSPTQQQRARARSPFPLSRDHRPPRRVGGQRPRRASIWVRGGCNSWYLDKTGLPNLYPFSPARFRKEMRNPDFAEYRLIEEAG